MLGKEYFYVKKKIRAYAIAGLCCDGTAASDFLCIVLAVPGFIGWELPYFVYKKAEVRQTEKLAAMIEEKFDEIYEICEKRRKLLY